MSTPARAADRREARTILSGTEHEQLRALRHNLRQQPSVGIAGREVIPEEREQLGDLRRELGRRVGDHAAARYAGGQRISPRCPAQPGRPGRESQEQRSDSRFGQGRAGRVTGAVQQLAPPSLVMRAHYVVTGLGYLQFASGLCPGPAMDEADCGHSWDLTTARTAYQAALDIT